MALNVMQYEEIAALLRQVPGLVDRLEGRGSNFVEGVMSWLKQAETVLENNRLPVVSQVASCRATLIQAMRGIQNNDVVVSGRATPRKMQEATASMVLQRGNDLLHNVIAERRTTYQDAERISRQMMAVAEAKGLVRACDDGRPHQQFLACLQQKIAEDANMASAYAHLLGLVGKTDILVFLDRALVRAS